MTLEKSTLQDHFYFHGLTNNLFPAPQEDDEERMFRVKGLKATSNEYYVAKALDTLHLEYVFQMTIGVRGYTGTTILDFLVMTDPLPTPLWVHGEHWHTGERRARDLRNIATVDQYLGGDASDAVEVWGDQTSNEQLALGTLRRIFR